MGFDVLKGRNQLYHVHAVAFLEGAVLGLGERLFHCNETSCSATHGHDCTASLVQSLQDDVNN